MFPIRQWRLCINFARAAVVASVLVMFSSLVFAWIWNTPVGSTYGSVPYDGDNGELSAEYCPGSETWANAFGTIEGHNASAQHEYGGGAYDENNVFGEIESTQPRWTMTATAGAFVKAFGSRVDGFGSEMQSKARATFIMDGTWSRWAAREVQVTTDLDNEYEADTYNISCGHDSAGVERTVTNGGSRRGLGYYPNYGNEYSWCEANWTGTSDTLGIDFTYKTDAHCYLKFDFSGQCLLARISALARQRDANYPECKPWNVRIEAFDGARRVHQEEYK